MGRAIIAAMLPDWLMGRRSRCVASPYRFRYPQPHRDNSTPRGHDAYNDIVAQQQKSTEAAKDVASFMSSWLAGIADDNVAYVVFLLNQLAEIANEIVAALVALADSFGVFTLLKLAELVGTFVEDAINILGETARRISSALTTVIEAERVLADESFFPGGNWPIAVDRP